MTPVYTGRIHGPYIRVYGTLFDTRIYGPYIRARAIQGVIAMQKVANMTSNMTSLNTNVDCFSHRNMTKKKKLLLLATCMSIIAKLRRRRRQRSCWTQSWLLRREHSISSTLYPPRKIRPNIEQNKPFYK